MGLLFSVREEERFSGGLNLDVFAVGISDGRCLPAFGGFEDLFPLECGCELREGENFSLFVREAGDRLNDQDTLRSAGTTLGLGRTSMMKF